MKFVDDDDDDSAYRLGKPDWISAILSTVILALIFCKLMMLNGILATLFFFFHVSQ